MARKSKRKASTEITNYFSAKKIKLERNNSITGTKAYLLPGTSPSEDVEIGKENVDPTNKATRKPAKKGRQRKVGLKSVRRFQTPLGAFESMPPEVLFLLFDAIPIGSIARLALTSKSAFQRVQIYYESPSAVKRFKTAVSTPILKPNFCQRCNRNHGDIPAPPDAYKEWGKLLKVLTMFLPADGRMDFIREFYEENHQADVGKDQAMLTGWGQLLITVMGHRDTPEFALVFTSIMSHSEVSVLRERFFSAVLGADPESEYRLRSFFRNIFLDHETNLLSHKNKATWLSLILRGLTVPKQGKLMALLCCETVHWTNPEYEFKVNWEAPCLTAVYNLRSAENRLKYYSEFLNLLLDPDNPSPWRPYNIFALVEEVTTFPESWAMDNFAALLLLTPRVGRIVLESRIESNHLEETVIIFSAMKNLTLRWPSKKPVFNNLLIESIQRCEKKEVRVRFLGELWEASLERDQELRHQITMLPGELMEERNGFTMVDGLFRLAGIEWGK